MPHYRDGTEAHVGDQVIGRLYNSGPEPKAGVIVSITPGVESCNAMVQFTEAVKRDPTVPTDIPGAPLPRMLVIDQQKGPAFRVAKGEAHGSAGEEYALFTCSDYCATNELTKVG